MGKIKIFINENVVETDRTALLPYELMGLAGYKGWVTNEDKYNIMLEVSEKYWEDISVYKDHLTLIEIKEGQRYKIFPKARM